MKNNNNNNNIDVDKDDGFYHRLNDTILQPWEGLPPDCFSVNPQCPIDVVAYVMRRESGSEGEASSSSSSATHRLLTFTEHRDTAGKYYVRCDLEAGEYRIVPG